jgi:hypothetical protein
MFGAIASGIIDWRSAFLPSHLTCCSFSAVLPYLLPAFLYFYRFSPQVPPTSKFFFPFATPHSANFSLLIAVRLPFVSVLFILGFLPVHVP